MINIPRPVEVSTQLLDYRSYEVVGDHSIGRPLFDLVNSAPDLSEHMYRSDLVEHPLSNDECTEPYFQQLKARTKTAEYQKAENRVAVFIGESALAANLPHIPEETIVLLDKSPDMNIFMDRYVESLREDKNSVEWIGHVYGDCPGKKMRESLETQIIEWGTVRRPHPFIHESAFRKAQEAARSRAIVTWNGDITSDESLAELGRALEDRNASVTMMNLTNVLRFGNESTTPRQWAAKLGNLPLTPQAPILTTGVRIGLFDHMNRSLHSGNLNVVTGPFLGLENLARAADFQKSPILGAIVRRAIVNEPKNETAITSDPDFDVASYNAVVTQLSGSSMDAFAQFLRKLRASKGD